MKSLPAFCFGFTLLLLATAHCGEIANQFAALPKDARNFQTSSKDYDRSTAQDTGITEVGLERTRCYGTCPAYTVIIKADGTLSYTGEAHVKKEGEHTGKVSTWELTSLFRFIKESDYSSLQDRYTAGITDHATVYTYVVMDGKKKIISNYANSGPAKLWGLEQLIDKLLLEAQWDEEKKKS